MWGLNSLIISSLSPKRDWGPKRVDRQYHQHGVFRRNQETHPMYHPDFREEAATTRTVATERLSTGGIYEPVT